MNKENDELIRGKRRLFNIYEDSSNISKEDIDKVLEIVRNVDPYPKTTYEINLNEIPREFKIPKNLLYDKEVCKNCNNNPKNGGSGICHCTLGIPELT